MTGSRISAVGPFDQLREQANAETLKIDAGGATVLPGFVESHLHLFAGAVGRRLLQLFGVMGKEALAETVQRYVADNPNEGLLVAKGADYTLLGEGVGITRQALDEVLPDRPLILIAPDHHTGWANTIALERAGVLNGATLGPGNEIVLDDQGLATGELREGQAMAPVMALRTSFGRENLGLAGTEPPETLTAKQRAEDKALLKEGLAYCAECGITSIHNMDGNWYQLELLAEIEAEGDLICRIEVPFHLTPEKPLSDLEQASQMNARFASDKLSAGRVKMFMDGVLDSGTAVMIEDYGDQPGWRGEPLHSAERFNAAATDIDARGLQIAVHAIGDGAVRMVLDGYEAARHANGARDSRHRIEHIEVVHPDDIPRFADLGVIASMQPPHPPGSMGLPLEPTVSKIGRDRWHLAYAWRSLRDAGARLCFASDWPVSPLEPMLGIQAAVVRERWDDDMPDQSATLDEAIVGYTRDGAYAGFDEARLGQIKPGMLADLVVLSGDIQATPIAEIDRITPVLTICDGQITYQAT